MPDAEVISVAIVEDEPETREGFAFLVGRTPGMSLRSVCESGIDAIRILGENCPAVVLMDVQLPGLDGISCIRELKTKAPATQFVVLTVFENDDVIFRALEAGASGYILKTAPPEKVIEAIREVYTGGAPMTAQIARRVVERFRAAAPDRHQAQTPEWALTNRESEVLSLLAQGHLYKEIAGQLEISIETVRKHLGRIYKKLHVKSRTEAVLKFLGH